MVHKDDSKGKRGRPRGRPFPPNNKRGKSKDDVLASSGHEIGDERGVIASAPRSAIVEENKGQKTEAVELNLPKESVENTIQTIKESMNTAQEEASVKEEIKDLELIESLEFKNGENTLSIRFSKKHNRMFRIQIYLNNKSEIRPITYTGASTGYAFWNFLKDSLKS